MVKIIIVVNKFEDAAFFETLLLISFNTVRSSVQKATSLLCRYRISVGGFIEGIFA